MDCGVCCNPYNISNHKKVSCSFCDYSSCRTCVQNYLLSTFQDSHCMNCKKLWNREFIDKVCTKTFRNGIYKKHREKILFEREKVLMPGTQPFVTRELKAREYTKFMDDINKRIQDLYKERVRVEEKIYLLRHTSSNIDEREERRRFVRKCPVEDCRGFLSTQWRCGVCEKHICSKCNEVNSIGHECDPEAVQTMELIKKDTKGCPSCGTMITFISGCRQMWCPDCHVAFDWNTLQIDTGRIHNPHYYEFKMRHAINSREHGDIPCGGLPDIYELSHALNVPRSYLLERMNLPVEETRILQIHRSVIHIDRIELQYVYNLEEGDNNKDLRMRYMMSEIDENVFQKKIQRREKCREKKRDIHYILRMFCDSVSDFLRQFVLDVSKRQYVVENLGALVKYTNEELKCISIRYNCVIPWIHENWEFRK